MQVYLKIYQNALCRSIIPVYETRNYLISAFGHIFSEFLNFSQYSFICRPSPLWQRTLVLKPGLLRLWQCTVRRSNHSTRPHPHTARYHSHSARSHPHSARSHPHSARSHPHSAKSFPHSARSHPHSARYHPNSAKISSSLD